jgi:hypothetical protein
MSEEYDRYLETHVLNVERAFAWLFGRLPLDLIECYWTDKTFTYIAGYLPISAHHDDTKWSESEYDAYDAYFFKERTEEVEKAFDYAWLHHIHNNPHHWQHWLLYDDDGEKPKIKALEMPKPYAIEMVADWWSFSWQLGDKTEILRWYDENKDKMMLHPNTRAFVEGILDFIRDNHTLGTDMKAFYERIDIWEAKIKEKTNMEGNQE